MNSLKIVSLFLLLVMPFSVSSAKFLDATEAANLLAEEWFIKDFSDEPSKYNLASPIQRQEIMKIAMNMSKTDVQNNCKWVFSDVDRNGWACKYIEAALEKGIITKNPKFRPNDKVTKTEAMKIIFKSMWLEKTTKTDNWQKDYMTSALDHGIISVSYTDFNAPATRAWLFQIAATTVEVKEEIEEKEMKKKLGLYSDEAE